jgi:ribosomal protein S18 acetylase RimI-like enzyme
MRQTKPAMHSLRDGLWLCGEVGSGPDTKFLVRHHPPLNVHLLPQSRGPYLFWAWGRDGKSGRELGGNHQFAYGGFLMNLTSGLCLDVEDEPTDADVEVLPHRLEDFNESRWPGHQPWRPLGVFVRDRQSIVAGLAGETYSGWLFVRYLWVSDGLRGQGIGSKLLCEGEGRALERGCHSVWLDTFSFQAPGFYQKLGYRVFGELDWSPDHKRFFLHKRLVPRAEE